MIRLENIHKQRAHLIMDITDLTIPRGLFTLVVGPNGQGKSTLLKLLAGALNDPHMIRSGYDLNEVAWMMDVYPFPDATVADSVEIFKLVHNDFDVDTFYQIYNQFNLKPFTKHDSEGEKRVLYFSLIASLKRSVYVLDEPTLNMDSIHVETLMQIIESMVSQRPITIICASNTLEIFESISDNVIAIYNGMVVVSDTVSYLLDAYPLWQGEKKEMPKEGVLACVHHDTFSEALIHETNNPHPTTASLSQWLKVYTKGGGFNHESNYDTLKK